MIIPGKMQFSTKHILIDKANSVILLAATATVAVVTFSLVVSKTFIGQLSYQNKVISLRSTANQQLQTNAQSVDAIVQAYKNFEAAEPVINTTDKNSIIVLDALPSKYDFPALVTSLEALIRESGASIIAITGTDEEIQAQQDSTNPKPIEMPFSLTAKGNITAVKAIIGKLEHSIRPINITSLSLTAADGQIQVVIEAKTYYQPARKIGFSDYVVSANGTVNTGGLNSTGATK